MRGEAGLFTRASCRRRRPQPATITPLLRLHRPRPEARTSPKMRTARYNLCTAALASIPGKHTRHGHGPPFVLSFFREESSKRTQLCLLTVRALRTADALEAQSDGGSAASRRARDDVYRQPLSAPRHHRRRHGRARLQPAPRAGRLALLHDGDRVRGMHGAEGARLRRHARRLRLPAKPHNKRLEVTRPQLRQLGACHVDPRGSAPSGPLLP